MWVKICGITRPEDAYAAAAMGADAVGFVLTVSPRRVTVPEIAGWIGSLEGVEKVGVFATEPLEEILDACQALSLDTVQLHRKPDPSHRDLAARVRIIYAMKEYAGMPSVGFDFRILLDASQGRGTRGLWHALGIPYILAGGLTPENVRVAIELARPMGVDVSTGVEAAPGIKDHRKMEKFIREARS